MCDPLPASRGGAAVTLFESEATCGGHTLTDDSSGYPVDLGFQVQPSLLEAPRCSQLAS